MKKFILLSRFFIKQSAVYIGKFTMREIVYYPIAYVRFIYFYYKANSYDKMHNQKRQEDLPSI